MGKSTIAKALGEFHTTYFNSHVTLLVLLLVGWVYWLYIINITSGKQTNFQIHLYLVSTLIWEGDFSPFSIISVALASGLPTTQFSIAYSIQEWIKNVWENYCVNVINFYLP